MISRDALCATVATVLLWSILIASYARAEPEQVVVNPPEQQSGVSHSGSQHTIQGRWYRGEHDGKYGWWWIVGSDWFYAKRPGQLAPELYVPRGEARGWWYLCPDNGAYYPFTTRCLSRWVRVEPR